MNIRVLNAQGVEVATKTALDTWDDRKVSPALLHQVAVAVLRNRRIPRAHTKDRAERRGGGRKPWRQKGTGRARQGSIRSPQWRKGGIVFGPRAVRTRATRITASMQRRALTGVLLGKIRDNEFVLLETLPEITGKTRELTGVLSPLPLRGRTLLLVPGATDARTPYRRASKNLPRIHVANPQTVTVADLLQHTTVLTTPQGLAVLEKRVAR